MAKKAAYGKLRLRPAEFFALNIMEFEEMLQAYNEAEQERRWEAAYWCSNIMSVIAAGYQKHPKPYQPKELMKPFLGKKTFAEIANERQSFFENFYKQRKEELQKHGYDS